MIVLFRAFIIVLILASSAHAGLIHRGSASGKSQLNFNFLFAGGAYPFINHLKSGAAGGNTDATRGGPAPNTLDANGYPTSISHSGVTWQFSVPSSTEYAGTWVVKWAGTGTVTFGGSVGTGCPCTGTNQKITFTGFSTQLPTVSITSVAGGPITDLAVYRSDEEINFNNGEIFSPIFKNKVTQGGFGVLRFLNWQAANTSNVTIWADRTPTTYVSYAGYTYKSAYYAGTSVRSAGDHYAITLGSGAAVDKQTVHVLWDIDATTAAPTLNLNASADVPIKDQYGNALTLGTTTPQNGRTSTLVYDSSLNIWLKAGGDAQNFNQGIINGVPPEYIVQLCHEVGMNPWVSQPYLTTVPISDYMIQFATYIKANGDSWMVPRYEGINEEWNSLFYGNGYARVKANNYWVVGGPPTNFNEFQGMAISLLGQAISTVYAGDRSKYQLIDGVQQSSGTGTSSSDARLASTAWIAAGTPTQAPYAVSAAYNWVTHAAPSSYVGATQSDSSELANAFSYVVTNAGNPSAQATLATAFVNSSYDPTCTFPFTTGHCSSGLNSKTYLYQQWYAWAQGNGKAWSGKNIQMTAYEGDWSPDYFTVGSAGDTTATAGSGGGNAVMTAVSSPGNPTTVTLDAGSAVPAVGMAVRPIGTGTALSVATASVSISAASPAQVTWTGNSLLTNQPVIFQNGSVPTGLAVDTVYYVKTPGNPFTVSATAGGAAINTTGSVGSATGIAGWTVLNVTGQVVTLDVDSSTFGTSSAGTAQYMGAALMRNTLRFASKSASLLQQLTIDNMNAFVTAGGNVPSNFQFTGDDNPATGSVWSALSSQFIATSPRWAADISYNANRTRQ